MDYPTGVVTFLFTDIEGSTRLWEDHGEAMDRALAQHDAIVREALEAHGGHVFKNLGDGFCAAFATASDALTAALAAQLGLARGDWPESAPLRIRVALHTGEAHERDGDYLGPPLNRCARILAAGHGGQVLLSRSTAELVRDLLPPSTGLTALGEHRLRDLARPETLFQLDHPSLASDFAPLRSLAAFDHNLPVQMTSFVGREAEIEEVRRLLGMTRLLTLTGTGGAGKTRLALQVGADALEAYEDGVWFVELAPLAEPSGVPQVVLGALGLGEEPQRALMDTLADALAPKHLLLLLDNCEHLIGTCAETAEHLLRACPRLTILATSRETLQAEGEVVWPVPSLSAPSAEAWSTQPLAALTQYAAVRLFIDRAVAASPRFQVTNDNAPAVAEICRRLDGIPLAVELAAARVNVLSPEGIRERLDDRFSLLTGGRRTAVPRQRTLLAAVEWSYELLSAAERLLFDRLSVFAGSFSLAAAEAVCGGEGLRGDEVAELLFGLAARSLVVTEDTGSDVRHRLLETLRAYGAERLEHREESEALSARHARHFMAAVEALRSGLDGPDQAGPFAQLGFEYDNVRVALSWTLSHDPAGGARLAGALARFWTVRGFWSEARSWLAAFLNSPSVGSRLRAALLDTAGDLSRLQGDSAAADQFLQESLALARQLGDTKLIANALNSLGNAAQNRAESASAEAYYQEALALRREAGDEKGVASVLHNLACTAMETGQLVRAQVMGEEGLATSRRLGEARIASTTLGLLASVAALQGDYAAGRRYGEEALALTKALGERFGIANALHNLGWMAHEQGDHAAAARLYHESLAINRELGARRNAANTLYNLGNLAAEQGRHGEARCYYEEAAALCREVGHTSGLAAVLGSLGRTVWHLGDAPQGRRLCSQGLELARELGDPLRLAPALENAGWIALADGDVPTAGSLLRESLGICYETGEKRAVAAVLEGLARVGSARGGPAAAAKLLGAADGLRETIGAPIGPADREEWDCLGTALRTALGEEAFRAAWDAGAKLALDEAVQEALQESDGESP